MDEETAGLDLRALFAALRRWLPMIVFCLVVTTGAAFGVSLAQTKQYTAEASLLFRDPGFDQRLFGSPVLGSDSDETRQAATNVNLVSLDVVADRAARSLGGKLDGDAVSSKVDVEQEGESDLVTVAATDPDPEFAATIANVFAKNFIVFRRGADQAKIEEAIRLVEGELRQLNDEEERGQEGQALRSQVSELKTLEALQTGNAELVQPADVPSNPSSPQTRRNTVLGVVLGLMLGVGIALLFERLNRRLREPEEAEHAFGLPILGTIPESKAIDASNQGASGEDLPFMEGEAFRMMQASLRYFNIDEEVRSVLITSSAAQAGKSTVAWNMARAAATSSRVVIVEADLRNPSLSRQHGVGVGPGLSEFLTHQVGLEDATQKMPVSIGGNGADGGEQSLDVIVAGSVPPNPAELIESKAMGELLKGLSESYDLVLVDTPPTGVVSDGFPLMRKVDGVIVVARLGVTTRDSAHELKDRLERLKAPLLGVVANGVKVRRRGKYGYGYGYYGPGPEERAEAAGNGASEKQQAQV